jgi:hypothetical protein
MRLEEVMRNGILMAVTMTAMAVLTGIDLSAGNVNIHARGAVRGCNDVDFSVGDRVAVRGEERLNIGGRSLALKLGDTKGLPVSVAGSDRSGYELLLCKGAMNSAELDAIRLQQSGGTVSLSGPEDSNWGAYLLVFAPRDAELDVETSNGPLSIGDIHGRLNASVKNGPLSLANVTGRVEASAKNGPISFSGRSGDVTLTAQNGPISLRLEGNSWEGGELRTSTKNGPLTLTVPAAYGTGIVVERGGHSPFRCPASLCGNVKASFNDDDDDDFDDMPRRIELGQGAARVHLSSVNGPIDIKEQ